MAVIPLHGQLTDAQHSAQLRKAVVAATIGTTIEWYDFFIYGTAAGLVFRKLFFPNEDPLTGTLASFGTYFVGFVGRPIGAAIFGHYGDRIGRKATLIATLLVMGIATFLVAFVPGYASIGIWGAVILTVLRMLQGIGVGGEWGGSVLISMEWARSHGSRGLVASWPQFGVPCGAVPVESGDTGGQRLVRRRFRDLGLARAVPAQHRADRHRAVDPARHPGDAGVPATARDKKIERTPIIEVIKQAAARDPAVGLAAHGRAGAVLHFHRLYLRLWRRHAEDVAGTGADGGAGGVVRVVHHHSAVGPYLRPDRAAEDVPDRRGGDRAVRLPVFRHAGHAIPVGWCSSRSCCRSFRTT